MVAQSNSWNESSAVDTQVEDLLQRLTLEEKIDLVSGKLAVDDFGNVPASPDGFPILALADGPAGLRLANPTRPDHRATALPAPIALAATWDPDLARRYGDVLGAEAVATGHNILLAPAVDIARAPLGGRTFESFGEDPLLQARLVAPEIEAIQAHGVVACIKHYVVNNQEYQRSTIDVKVDERTLQEIYLPPFAAAVRDGHVAAVMGSYNRINGTYACENRHTLTEILRDQLGFRGFVMSDFMGNQSTIESAHAGLDWELGAKMWGPRLVEAVQSGQVPIETIDEMVRRILRPIIGLGLIERPIGLRTLPVQQHSAEARLIAEQSIVLLKNANGLLPLDNSAIRSIAVIGPDADSISAAGGGSARVQPMRVVSVLDGIRQRAGEDIRVGYAPGVDPIGAGVLLPGWPAIPSDFFIPPDHARGEYGLRVEYWANPNFDGEPQVVRIEPRAELNFGFFDLFPGWNVASPRLPSKPAGLTGRISVRWTGDLSVPASGDYTLSLTCLGTARLYLDAQLLIDSVVAVPEAMSNPRIPPDVTVSELALSAMKVYSTIIQLTADEPHPVIIEYSADAPGQWFLNEAMCRLGWQPPMEVTPFSIAETVAFARQSEVAIVVVRTYETEEMDRPDLRLPNGQDQLIRAVAAANPRTIVVLMNGGPVEIASWVDDVPAVLEAWFAGQEQGRAIARVLFGDVNPAGKLPLTFPRNLNHTPIATHAQYPGIDGAVHYSEGTFVGYRGCDRFGIEPQYPFGHGLSYTSFEYSQLRLPPEDSDGTQAIEVRFEIANIGDRAGVEVAQVYLGLPASVSAAAKKLAGWARVALEPGEQQIVAVTLEPQSSEHPLSFWSADAQGWKIVNGGYTVYVGASSRDIRLMDDFQIRSQSSSLMTQAPG
jgi:beta-glucosidase